MKQIYLELAVLNEEGFIDSEIISKCQLINSTVHKERISEEDLAKLVSRYGLPPVKINCINNPVLYNLQELSVFLNDFPYLVFYATALNENASIKTPYNPIISNSGIKFEVRTHIPGKWKKTIDTLYSKFTVDSSKKELDLVNRNFGLVPFPRGIGFTDSNQSD